MPRTLYAFVAGACAKLAIVHTRRVAAFLLGVWLGCSVLVGLIAIENLRLPGAILASSSDQAGQIAKKIGPEDTRLLLRHQAAEQNRVYFYRWEQVEIFLALALAICLFLGTQRRILPLILCGLLVMLVLFEHFGLTPELTFIGREADFPPGSVTFGTQSRVWALDQVYAWAEGVKLLLGAVLAGYLFIFRTRQRGRKSVSAADRVSDAASTHPGPSELRR
jgi:hypothetical protein